MVGYGGTDGAKNNPRYRNDIEDYFFVPFYRKSCGVLLEAFVQKKASM